MRPKVERLARHLLDDPEDARDAAQESLAKLCVRIRQFRGEARFSTWLHRLVVNTCRDVAARRRARPWEPLVEDERAATTGDPARAAQLSELRRELCSHLQEIPDRQAMVVVLKDALELSFDEISTAEGMPVGTAKCYAHRGPRRAARAPRVRRARGRLMAARAAPRSRRSCLTARRCSSWTRCSSSSPASGSWR